MATLTEQAEQLIDGNNFACIATLMPDGSPQVTPVWVEREGGVVVINSTMSRQRTRNLRRDPRVALTIFDMGNPYRKVVIRGRVIEITQEGGEEGIDRLSLKYTGEKYRFHDADDPRVIIRVSPKHVTH